MAGEEIRDLQLMPGNRGLLAATGDCRILLFQPEVSRLSLFYLYCQLHTSTITHDSSPHAAGAAVVSRTNTRPG